MKPLAITGLGIVSPIGIGRLEWNHALSEYKKAHLLAFRDSPTVLHPEKVPEAIAAEVWSFDATQYLGKKGLRNFDRLTKFLIVAARLALQDAGIKRDGEYLTVDSDRIGICTATAYGSLDSITEMLITTELEDPRYVNPNRFPNTVINSASGYVSIWENLRAPNTTIVDGNCGSLDAVLTCDTHLECGRADMFIVGGGEVLNEPLFLAFRKLAVLAERNSEYAPGFPQSCGMRMGEGAVYLCIERMEVAKSREATVFGKIIGYGNAFEPPSSEAVLVHSSKTAVERAIRIALKDAAIDAADIDIVCLSANGIPAFDKAELDAVREVFGSEIAATAPKAVFGETLGAGGAFGIATILSWFEGHYASPIVNGKVCINPRSAMVISVGFYGNVSVVVLQKSISDKVA